MAIFTSIDFEFYVIPIYFITISLFSTDRDILLCDFHRKQSWQCWVRSNLPDKVTQKQLISYLDTIASSATDEEYKAVVEALQAATVYDGKVRSNAEETWLKHKEVIKFLSRT